MAVESVTSRMKVLFPAPVQPMTAIRLDVDLVILTSSEWFRGKNGREFLRGT